MSARTGVPTPWHAEVDEQAQPEDASSRPEDRLEVLARLALLFEAELDRFDRVRRQDGSVLALVAVDQGSEDLERVTGRGAGRCVP